LGCTSRKLELPQIKEEKARRKRERGGVNIGEDISSFRLVGGLGAWLQPAAEISRYSRDREICFKGTS